MNTAVLPRSLRRTPGWPLLRKTPCRHSTAAGLAGILLGLALADPALAGTWSFTEVSLAAGLDYSHGFLGGLLPEERILIGGVAAGDFDGDGWTDLYVVRGDIGPNLLFRNRGDGTFEEVGDSAGLAISGALNNGPTWGDVDGDGWLDLIIGGIESTPAPRLFRNRGDGTFEDITDASGIAVGGHTFSSTFGDYDGDGDLDLVLSFWTYGPQSTGQGLLWQNDGTGHFTDVTATALGDAPELQAFSFTPNFADLDADGDPDLLMAADFGTSWYALNQGDGTFTIVDDPVISDENGMGTAIGDYDGDGDLDWFVSSIWDPDGVVEGNWGISGNRLYRNDGQGHFADATDEAGVRHGYWGWGSCFADFDNDGILDLFQTNGYSAFEVAGIGEEFWQDPARFFSGNGDGTFSERSTDLGLDDTGQGRGVVCFDYDHDGDLDLFIANNDQPPALYRNDGGNAQHYLSLTLRAEPPNPFAIGTRILLTADGSSQLRELRDGSHYLSQDPPGEAHFGLGTATEIDRLTLTWPDGEATTFFDLAVDQHLEIQQGVRPAMIFPDDFESGDTSHWSATVN